MTQRSTTLENTEAGSESGSLSSTSGLSRRRLLGAAVSLAAGMLAPGLASGQGSADFPPLQGLPRPDTGLSPERVARDEAFWREVAGYYDRTQGIVNLEHGYWGKMAKPVQDRYLAATRMINSQNSFYARKGYGADAGAGVERIANALGVPSSEIAITRNATEAIHSLIRQYRDLELGDAVLYADIDYPSFKRIMRWRGESGGGEAVEVIIPQRANQQQILDLYVAAFDANPRLKLMLLTHVSNQHGLVVPVADIAAAARARGIDVICDCAQSWGLLDFTIDELGVDWAVFNLHKWIGSPVGVGALYMRQGSLAKIDPYPGDSDTENNSVASRVHMATSNFAAFVSVPAALDFHEAIGGPFKEARLRYLRSLWTDEADGMPHIEVLGGADEASWTGMAGFRLAGKGSSEDASALQARLENEFGIFTVGRFGLASGSCIRVTPQVFTEPREIEQLVNALRRMG